MENIDPEILKKYKDAPYRAPLIIVLVADTKEHPKVPIIEQQLSTAAAGQKYVASFSRNGLWRYLENRKIFI